MLELKEDATFVFIEEKRKEIIRLLKVRFKIIGRVIIFPYNFAISGATWLIFSYIVEIGERYILSYLIFKVKQNGTWKTYKNIQKIRLLQFCINAHKMHISGINHLRPTWKYKSLCVCVFLYRVKEWYVGEIDSKRKKKSAVSWKILRGYYLKKKYHKISC